MSGKDIIPPLENGLKLLFAQDARALLDQYLASVGLGNSHKNHFVTTCYDSTDLLLRQSGLSLRIRRSGRECVQSLKAVGEGDQPASPRGEWEWAIKTDQPDLSLLSGTPHGPLVMALEEKLIPVWVSDVHRTTHMVQHDGAMVMAAIDEGSIRGGNAHDTVREVGLEIRDGPARGLYTLAMALQAVAPLTLGVLTEAERGYHLLTGAPVVSMRFATPSLTRRMTLADSFRTLIRSGLNILIRNQPAAGTGDPEGIHQMRVAIRQLRTMLQIIGDTDPAAIRLFQSGLRRIGRELGHVRDWDVLCLETLPAACAADDGGDLIRMLGDVAQDERATAHQHLRHELETPALTTLVLSLANWVEGAAFPEKKGGRSASLSRAAPRVLDHLEHRVTRRGRHIRRLSTEERHALRRAFKKLRYGASYFAVLYPSRTVKTYMKGCKKLQRDLGRINDAAVAARLVHTLGETHPHLAPGAGIFARWNDRRQHKALRSLHRAWKDFRSASPFWH